MQKTIFVVDDNDTNLSTAEAALKEEYQVMTLPSATAMFELLEELASDLILLDIEMPEMDGFEALQQLKASEVHAGIPVIFLTGRTDTATEVRGFEMGAVDFITKPFSAPVLKNRVRNHLNIDNLIRELAESREQYRTIYNNAAMGIYLNTQEGKILTCNKAFAAILGYDGPEELLALLRNQDDQYYDKTGRRQELLALLREKREVSGFESGVLGRDGDLVWVSESCTPIFGPDGALLHYEVVVSDITARRQAEDELRTTYNLIRTAIDSLHNGILVTDLDGHLVMANNAASVILGQQLQPGEKPAFLVDLPNNSPFIQFQKHFDLQSGVVSISPGHKPVHCIITPYKNAINTVIGAVHVLDRST